MTHPAERRESHQPHPLVGELAKLQPAPIEEPVCGTDWVEGATIADEERIHGVRTSIDGDMKKKKEKTGQKHEKRHKKNGEKPPGPKQHKAVQGEDGGIMRR